MALSYVRYIADGNTDVFSVTFPYISASHVEVYKDGVLQSSGWSWATGATIQFTSNPGSGVVVMIKRNTPKDSRLVDFTDGNMVFESELDKNTSQMLYIIQEAYDTFSERLPLDTIDNKWDAGSKPLKNLSDPTNAQDAVTKNWIETVHQSALDAAVDAADADRVAAEAAQAAAEHAQADAEHAQADAEAAQAAAEQWADQAEQSANNLTANKHEVTTTVSQSVFTLPFAVSTIAPNLSVFVNGVYQAPSAYTITDSTTITLSEVVPANTHVAFASAQAETLPDFTDIVRKTGTPASGDGLIYNGNLWVPSNPHRKNFIINGDMGIWQRGVSLTSAPSLSFLADRFKLSFVADGAVDLASSGSVPASEGFVNSLLTIVRTPDSSIAAGQIAGLLYAVEGYDFRAMVGREVTLSFWVRSHTTGIFSVAFRTGTSVDRSYVADYTVNVVDTWEKKTITVTLNGGGDINLANGTGMQLYWALACGSTYQTPPGEWKVGNFIASTNQCNWLATAANEFRITGVQLELGPVATPFEFRHFAEELALCQRYYENGSYAFTAPTAATNYITVPFKVTKRSSTTTVILTSPPTGAAGYIRHLNAAADVAAATPSGLSDGFLYAHSGLTDQSSYQFIWAAAAEL